MDSSLTILTRYFVNKFCFVLAIAPLGNGAAILSAADTRPAGDSKIRAPAGDSEIVINTTSRLAGAIHSLTWNGKEFINSHDHGRQLQTAVNCNAGSNITAETFNPTEAGSRDDGAGPTSTSRLLHLVAHENQLQTTTQMAFWLAPGQESSGQLAKNKSKLSNHLLTKRVTIGEEGYPQLLRYRVTVSLPVDEQHEHVVFEALTGYMPPEFDTFLHYDPEQRQLLPLSDGPGEQQHPLVLATSDGMYAMGILAEESAIVDMRGPKYGRFRFPGAQVVKWNCVYRLTRPQGIPPGDYSFSMRVLIGTRADVETMLQKLTNE